MNNDFVLMNHRQRRRLGILAFRWLVLFASNWFCLLLSVLFAVKVCYVLLVFRSLPFADCGFLGGASVDVCGVCDAI